MGVSLKEESDSFRVSGEEGDFSKTIKKEKDNREKKIG
jgi:hypothetical protein